MSLHSMPRADVVHILYMPRADFRPRADTLDVCYWFWLQFRTQHPWKHWYLPQNYGGSPNPLLALKLFLESFYTWMKVRSCSKPHTFQSVLHMLNNNHLNLDGPPSAVKCVRKFGSPLGEEVTSRYVRGRVSTLVLYMQRVDFVHDLYMQRADAHVICCWF